ncbi:MAG: hypothetical protein ACI8QS_000603 [Planctomycetota bacterium]|jgi:hypothetical protein
MTSPDDLNPTPEPKPLPEFERPGSFYLGRRVDDQLDEPKDVLYSAKDLTTHAVCVGMTGSGKTGLGVCLLEEAALDGIPALIVDPKGDMGNLLLQFPDLEPEDFQPWVDPDAAKRKGKSLEEFAESTADMWRAGLEKWGQGGERVLRLRESAEVAVYTPGSDAGIPMSLLKSFNAPTSAVLKDRELLADRIEGATAGLLALLGIEADPLQSRETILVSAILKEAWSKGEDLDIAGIIRAVQSPPFETMGVFELETFYPQKERMQLAMQLNALLASPGFEMWSEGVALDIDKLLFTPEGKPRLAVLSIAHLSDVERMSFVTVLLNEVLTWMRTQPGTSSLRALLYMDEIFGFFPPTAEPPSKRPMLTLLKQARAYGLGIVLATQNPVDLDYKGLSNTGTWFLGRLQTERDKQRVLDGLEGAMDTSGKGFDRRGIDRVLSGLGKRVFLLHNVHEDAPIVFHTRWALSYLRGPMTREELRRSMANHPLRELDAEEEASQAEGEPAEVDLEATGVIADAADASDAVASALEEVATGIKVDSTRPSLPAEVRERFLLPRREAAQGTTLLYRPALAGEAKLHYSRVSIGLEEWRTIGVTVPLVESEEGPDFDGLKTIDGGLGDGWGEEAAAASSFGKCPDQVTDRRRWRSWAKELEAVLYRERPATIWRAKKPKLASNYGEVRGLFEERLAELLRQELREDADRLKQRFESKMETQRDRIRRAEEKVAVQEQQYSARSRRSWIDVGTTIFSALFSRSKASSSNARRAGSAAKAMDQAAKEKEDVARAESELDVQREKLRDLEADLEQELRDAEDQNSMDRVPIEELVISPRKSDLDFGQLTLLWVPYAIDHDGKAQSLL